LHAWFEERGPPCCLLVFIDDATSRLTQLRFLPRECTLGYMQTLHGHIGEYWLPMAVYSDQHGIFRINVGDTHDDHVSQFGRALATLGIESICTTSPQAKGRVERVHATLQDHLVKAMRLAGTSSIDAANAWLPDFVVRHNARFAATPADAHDAHVPHPVENDAALRRILSKHYPRTLSNQLSCQFHSTLLQAHTASSGTSLRGAKVTVLEHFDQSLQLRWKIASLSFSTRTKVRGAPLAKTRKEVLAKPRPVRPAANHPWRTTPIGALSPEFVVRS